MRLISIPANPVPDDAATAMLQTPDDVLLRYARWAPPPGRKGTVCIFQGRAEFIEKYYEVVRDLRARGFAVATFDWRGQGLSQRALKDPRKGHVGSFAEFAIDLETFMKEVVLPDCPPPLFALAHSMGAAVLIQAAAKGHRWFDRMVLTAPMIRLAQRRMYGMAPALARIVRFAGRGGGYVPGGGPAVLQTRPFPGNPLTGDPVRYARAAAVIETEPALGLGSPTVGWADAAFRVMAQMRSASFPAQQNCAAKIPLSLRENDRFCGSLALPQAIPFCSTNTLSGVIGRSRTRTPVALKIEFAIAAGTPAIPISPIPRTPRELKVVSGMLRNSTSMCGISAFVGTKYSAILRFAIQPLFGSILVASSNPMPIPKTMPPITWLRAVF